LPHRPVGDDAVPSMGSRLDPAAGRLTMQTVTTEYAAAHLEELIERVSRGETVQIATAGAPVARVIRIEDEGDAEVPAYEVEEAFHGD
jgi:prevent-host-death family protein